MLSKSISDLSYVFLSPKLFGRLSGHFFFFFFAPQEGDNASRFSNIQEDNATPVSGDSEMS